MGWCTGVVLSRMTCYHVEARAQVIFKLHFKHPDDHHQPLVCQAPSLHSMGIWCFPKPWDGRQVSLSTGGARFVPPLNNTFVGDAPSNSPRSSGDMVSKRMPHRSFAGCTCERRLLVDIGNKARRLVIREHLLSRLGPSEQGTSSTSSRTSTTSGGATSGIAGRAACVQGFAQWMRPNGCSIRERIES